MAKTPINTDAYKNLAAPAKDSVGRMAEKPEERLGLYAEISRESVKKIRMMSVDEERPLREIVGEAIDFYLAHKEKQTAQN